jgi:hypothetical protein
MFTNSSWLAAGALGKLFHPLMQGQKKKKKNPKKKKKKNTTKNQHREQLPQNAPPQNSKMAGKQQLLHPADCFGCPRGDVGPGRKRVMKICLKVPFT